MGRYVAEYPEANGVGTGIGLWLISIQKYYLEIQLSCS